MIANIFKRFNSTNKMKLSNKFLLIPALLLLSSPLHAQNYWGNVYGGNQNDETFAVEIDYPSGNTSIEVGYFTGTSNFNGINHSSNGFSDIFITKHASDGTFLWMKQIGGSGEERAVSISLDATGNIFITGHFWGSFDFNGTTYTSYGQEDAFVAKLDQNGNPLWFVQEGGTSSDLSFSIEVDINGDAVITGEFNGVSTFGATVLTSVQEDAFIAKYNGSTGNLLWVQQGTADFSDRGMAICTDENANIYVTGQFSDTITFDVTHNYNLYNGIYVIKFDPLGNEQWFRVIAGGVTNIAYDITADHAGNIYLTGDFTGGLQFLPPINQSLSNPHFYKVFVAKLSTSGNLVWAKADGSDNEITSRAIDVKGSQVGIAGMFKCTFDEYANLYGAGIFNSVGYWDCFATSFDLSGNRQWARQWASARNDKATGIAIDNSGIFLLSGSTNKNLMIPTPNTSSPNWTPIGSAGSPNYGYCSEPLYGSYNRFTHAGKADAFVGKLIDPTRSPYDYYSRVSPGCTKSYVPGCINSSAPLIPATSDCALDTIMFCGHGWLYGNTHTWPDTSGGAGPNFHYAWNPTYPDTVNHHITSSGQYSVTLTSFDGCYTTNDDMYAIVYPLPQKPLITDNAVVNDHDLLTQLIEGCEPDSFLLTGTPVGNPANYINFHWGTSPGTDSTEWVNTSGWYYFYVTDTNGCSQFNKVDVILHPAFQNIVPKIICNDDTDQNDSINICQNHYAHMQVIDTLTHSGMIPDLHGSCIISAPGFSYNLNFANDNIGNGNSLIHFIPTVDDQLYTITCHLTQINICDTVVFDVNDEVFIHLNPNPVAIVNLTGPTSFCSGDSVVIIATGSDPIIWSYDPAAEVYFNGVDSLIIDFPTIIYVSVHMIDSNGCYSDAYDNINVTNPTPPTASTYPTNGLICPNDSVQMNIYPSVYTNYTWVGPGLLSFPNSPSVYTSVPGLYYCTVIDANGCELVSNIIEIYEYSTPGLYVVPNNMLCAAGDTASIHVTTNVGSTIHWINPSAGGSSPEVLIDQPGIYTCEILSCGILTVSNITIELDTNTANVYATSDPVFCENSDFVINATPGYLNYLWQPGSLLGQNITVTTGGNYFVTVTDEFGCEISSDTIVLTSYPTTAENPDTASAYFCAPDFVTLYATASGIISWYDSPTSTTPINIGGSFTTPTLNATTTYYVQNTNDSCTSSLIPIYAIAIPCDSLIVPNVLTPNGDGLNDGMSFALFGSTCLDLVIYDRWGTEVFSSSQPGVTWYGRNHQDEALLDGVYFYVVQYCPHNKPVQIKKGFIQIFN
jgi:gliding motility-associated-like protein